MRFYARIFVKMNIMRISIPKKTFDSQHLRAAVLMMVGLVLLALMNVVVKYLAADYSGVFIAFVRNISGLVVGIHLMLFQGYFGKRKRQYLKISRIGLGFGRGAIIAAGQICFFTALQYIELATARALSYSSSLFVTLLAIVILREKCGIWRMSAVIVGLLGTFMVLGESILLSGAGWYYLIPVIGAVFYAMSLISLQLFAKTDHHLVLVFYTQISASVITAILVTLTGYWQPVANLKDFFLMGSIGVLGSFAVLCVSYAYRFSEASFVAPFHYIGLIYAMIFGFLIFGEAPFAQLFPGVILIVGAGFVTLWREARRRHVRNRLKQ